LSEIADAVAGTIGDLFGGEPTEEATAEVAEVTAPEAEVATDEFPDWEAAGRGLFEDDDEDEPDFTAEAEAELGLTEDAEDVLAPAEYDDENTARLKREALAAKKRAEHYERLHLKTSRKNWEADVRSQTWGEFLPPDLSSIKASSHRDFIKQAKATAKSNYAVLKPHYERLQAERSRLESIAKGEARQEVQAAWGRPTVGSARVPDTSGQLQGDADQATQDALQEARRTRSMTGAVKALIAGDLI